MGNARNLANLLSGGDSQLTAADIDDNSITADKLANSAVTNAKISNSTIDATTKLTGAIPIANGGHGLTGFGSSGSALIVNDAGTAFEFGSAAADLTPLQKDIAILNLTDNINQSRGYHNLSSAVTDTFENTDKTGNNTNVTLQTGGMAVSSSAGAATDAVYVSNVWGGTSLSSADGQSFSTINVTTGTGAWESGGTSFAYTDITDGGTGSGWALIPQGTDYNWETDKVVFTYQMITKAGGSGPGFVPALIKGVATNWSSYGIGRNSPSAIFANPGIQFNSDDSTGQQLRYTYDPITSPNVILGEERSTNSGTWSGTTETYGTNFTSLSAANGIVHGTEIWKDSNPAWVVRMWAQVTPGNVNATGTFQSTSTTIANAVTQMSCVILYKNSAGTATLNTDLKVSLSADNGSNFTQVTLTASGTGTITTGQITAVSNKVTVTSGTQVRYKVEYANQSGSKSTRVQGVSLIY